MSCTKSTHIDSIENRSLPPTPEIVINVTDSFVPKQSIITTAPVVTSRNPFIYHKKEKIFTSNNSSFVLSNISTRRSTKIISNAANYFDLSDDENLVERKPSVHLPKPLPNESEFLKLVYDDEVMAIKSFLHNHAGFNINCTDFQGVSALHIAVQNRSEAMVEFLLKQTDIEIGDTVLHAARDNSIKILVLLLEAQKKKSPGLEFAGTTHSPHFPEYVTPLFVAAHADHYEAIGLLVSRGHTISRPHLPYCCCMDCKNSHVMCDQLHASNSRLSMYRAICSPSYLIHVSSDPIFDAFILTEELLKNASAYRHLAPAYMNLRISVKDFAVDLIDCCRTSQEVEIILKQTSGVRGKRHFVLPRLLMAMDYKQKEFVAHPNTQQVLESYWLGDWYSWKSKSYLKRATIVTTRIFLTPLMVLMCVVAPKHSLVKQWQIPFSKLITHASGYLAFLALVFYISNQDKRRQKRGPPNTGAEAPLILFVSGYTWSAVRMYLMQGPRRYFKEMWNWAEIIMLSLFWCSFVFWTAAAVDVAENNNESLERKLWKPYDPTLLAEGTFCLATICAFFRLMCLCQLNYHLGPLQVSLGKMTIDIYRYIIVFAIIISAFAAGLSRFYEYYNGMVYEDEFGMKTVQVSSFTSLSDTLNTLFWALFCMAPLESADVVLENTKDPSRYTDKSIDNRHSFTERVGYFCFGCFEVISVIVVLNMLIATMSNTFQRVTDNVAIEWTFGKTEVYVDYMMQTTLSSPFNMIPTAAGMSDVVEWLRHKVIKQKGVNARWSLMHCCFMERDAEANLEKEYPALMSVLVQRYFREKKGLAEGKSNSECQLETIKRELSNLRNSLRNSS